MHRSSTAAITPEEFYAREKRRGMDFVTIADRDSIDAVRQIAGRPDVFMSVVLTARARDSAATTSLLCWGVSDFDHHWLQRHRDDRAVCEAYLREHSIAWAAVVPRQAGTYTETPYADTPWDFLRHVRRGWSEEHWLRGNTSFPIPSHPDNFGLPLAS
jgi:hypothetical protein